MTNLYLKSRLDFLGKWLTFNSQTDIYLRPMILLSSIPEKLRSFRALRGLTQQYMAHKLNISQKTYSRWENGANELSLSLLGKICSVLGVGIEQLVSTEPVLAEELQQLRSEICALKQAIAPPPA
jgi:transcriptional regulator with XRE-family HTH domain